MNRSAAILAASIALGAPAGVSAQEVDWSAVERAMDRTGAAQPDGVHRFSMPRSDLKVTVDGVPVAPALALGSWVAMAPLPDGTVLALGDLVLTQEEVQPVTSTLQEAEVMQTALHNHLLLETPRVMYLHIYAEGDGVRIARAIRAALARTATPGRAGPTGMRGELGLDTAGVAEALGHHGVAAGGVYKISVPRPESIRVEGHEVPSSMGLATSIGFQPTGGGKAAVTGDFVLVPAEVNPVIRALREHGIAVTGLHNHLLVDEPRLFFMHFWAVGDAVDIGGGLHAALGLIGTGSGR